MLESICARFGALADQVELVVALGGGSVIDSAKFLAAGHLAFEPTRASLEGGADLAQPAWPLVAIPTTAGTGSDLTKWATIWDPATDRKLSLNRDDLYARVALVDPDITASLPWSMTLATGLDALSHALESLWNRNANPASRRHAVSAAREILLALPQLREDPSRTSARTSMALGATFAGLAFSSTQTALAHNISYPITLKHGVVHGIACSFCLPEVMVAARGISPDCDAALAEVFGGLDRAPERLRSFLDDLGVVSTPAQMGIDRDEWIAIVRDAFAGPRGRNFIGTIDGFPEFPVHDPSSQGAR